VVCLQVPQRDVKLIILDSIAALLRTEFGGGEAAALAARGEMLGQQAAVLKAVAEANRIPVVVTNQVGLQCGWVVLLEPPSWQDHA
jgi:RecA/RadA recombinase